MATSDCIDRNMPILGVDDMPAMRRIMKNCLRQLGFSNVSEAESGTQALEQMANNEFGFVISDWQMPEMDGPEFIQSLKSNPKTKQVPVLVVTQETQKEAVLKKTAEIVSGVIVKPFTAEVLKMKMQDALHKSI